MFSYSGSFVGWSHNHFVVVANSFINHCTFSRFMDKRMMLKLNGGRTVVGILRGFDPFMNVVIDETVEECRDGTRNTIGMVVSRIDELVFERYSECQSSLSNENVLSNSRLFVAILSCWSRVWRGYKGSGNGVRCVFSSHCRINQSHSSID